jgi:hypothetical protein
LLCCRVWRGVRRTVVQCFQREVSVGQSFSLL